MASEGEDPIGAIQDKVNKTTETMKENIKEVLKREENLKTTEVTTRHLNEESALFHHNAQRLKRKYFFKNVKIWIILIVTLIIILITLIAALAIIGTFNSQNAQN